MLYEAVRGRWECHRCGNLKYECEGKTAAERALRRARKIRGYCGGSDDPGLPFPERPEGMTARVYESLKAEAARLEALPAEMWLAGDDRQGHGVRRDKHGATKQHWWPGRSEVRQAKEKRAKWLKSLKKP